MKKLLLILIACSLVIGGACYYFYRDPFYFVRGKVNIEKIELKTDKDGDGLFDLDDIVEGARREIANRTQYRSAYYEGGYPPKNEGVCTDVIWRGLKNAGYDLKALMDADIKENVKDYPRVNNAPDPNIDFRRVGNQYVFLKKYATVLTVEVKPYDRENLKQWQAGDIITLDEHIAIVSDKRRKDGVPYIIHNASTVPKEEDKLLFWRGKITGHFRFPGK